MRILVTGASGLLGRKLAELASERGFEVYAAYKSNPVNIGNPVRFDLTDRVDVLAVCEKIKPHVIVNSAALTDVDLCERERGLAVAVNAAGPGFLAEAALSVEAHFVQVSTDYVFDGEKGVYSEGDEPNPLNHYGYSKLLGEKKVISTARSWCIARTSVVFGWGGAVRPNFAVWVLGGLRDGKKLSVVRDQYASPTLNTNLAEMLLEISERKLAGIYHVAGRDRISRYDMASRLADAFNLDKALLSPVDSPSIGWLARRPEDSSLSVEKALRELKSKPLPLDEAIAEMKVTEIQETGGDVSG